MHAISTLLDVKLYSNSGFSVQFLASRNRDILEQLLDTFAKEYYFMGGKEFSFHALCTLIKRYFLFYLRNHLDVIENNVQRNRALKHLARHLEEALHVMGLIPWIRGRIKFWFFLFKHARMRFFNPDQLMDLLDGFILTKDIQKLVEHNMLSYDHISQLSWKMMEKATCPMSWSCKELGLPKYVFKPETVVINRLHFGTLQKCINLHLWYLHDLRKGIYCNEQASVRYSGGDLSEFVWGVMSDVLPQIHFQTLGYADWEAIFLAVVREALSEIANDHCCKKNISICHVKLQKVLESEVVHLVDLCKSWIELLMLANGMAASFYLNNMSQPLTSNQVMCMADAKTMFHTDRNLVRRAVFLVWCLRSRPASIYHAACARVIVRQLFENNTSAQSVLT